MASLAGCAALGRNGPTTSAIKGAAQSDRAAVADIKVIPLDDAVARRVIASRRSSSFSQALGDGVPYGALIGNGDVLDISIWEAPPAALFGSGLGDTRQSAVTSTARSTTLPEQVVDTTGRITVPFVGHLLAAGRTTAELEGQIVSRLAGMAHQPQVIVRLVRNATASVTVVGDVANSARVPLTPKGERLLDIIAGAGGVRQPVGKTTIQVARAGRIAALPLEQVIADPAQNIRMESGDVVTALFQPFSFTALGAIGNNAEVPFEGNGLSLAQALGRIGGLRDDRADVRGVFVFRLEDPSALDPAIAAGARTTPEGKIPVIYELDLSNPAAFFVAQGFPVRNQDVIYVSNAPGADLQKFVGIVSSMAFSIVGIKNGL